MSGRQTNRAPGLRYGDRLPELSLYAPDGRAIEHLASTGKWQLLVFVDTACEPCRRELQALSHAFPELQARLNVAPIMEDQPFLMSAKAAADRFQRQLGLCFPVSPDPDRRAMTACGVTGQGYPYAVLADPSGIVRLVTNSSEMTSEVSTRLVDGLRARFLHEKPQSVPLVHWIQVPRDPVIPVTLEDGKTTDLSKLSQNRVLVMTFLTGGDPAESQRLHAIRRFSNARSLRFLFVVNDARAKPAWLKNTDRWLIADKGTTPLFNAYHVIRGPVSMIFYNGRRIIEEGGVLQSGFAFESELAYAAFLAS